VLWVLSAILIALLPEGCIGDDCDLPGRTMRDSGSVGLAMTAALLLLVVATVAVIGRMRSAGRFGKLGTIGATASGIGIAVVTIAGLVQAALFAGDLPAMPYVLIPGALCLILGFVLLGIAVLRADVLPGWVAILLVFGTWLMLGYNDQNIQVLFAVPFGLAWIAVGWALRTPPA
jgi:hypothetical protein